jgi:dihydroflavonol-4-reductase
MDFVTGGTGLVGSHLILELTAGGKPVKALKRPGSDLSLIRKVFQLFSADPEQHFRNIEWIEGDITDIHVLDEAMAGVENVYHCAAIVSFQRKDLRRMMHVNVEGTANMVNAALYNKARKLCHVSSIAALGRPENETGVINEKAIWKASRNNSGYAVSKYGAEREVWRGIAEGLNAVIVNPSIILGFAGKQKGSSRLFTTVWQGLKFYPSGTNGFVNVKDVAKAMIQLAESNTSGERFILNSDNVEYRRLFNLIAAGFRKPGPKWKAGSILTGLGWRYEKLRGIIMNDKPLITEETARTANNKYLYSNEKIRDRLGFEFISIEDTIKHYCEIFMNDINTSKSPISSFIRVRDS